MGPDWKQKQGFQIPGVRLVHITVAPGTPAYGNNPRSCLPARTRSTPIASAAMRMEM
jgi:hypothetical protein